MPALGATPSTTNLGGWSLIYHQFSTLGGDLATGDAAAMKLHTDFDRAAFVFPGTRLCMTVKANYYGATGIASAYNQRAVFTPYVGGSAVASIFPATIWPYASVDSNQTYEGGEASCMFKPPAATDTFSVYVKTYIAGSAIKSLPGVEVQLWDTGQAV